LPQSHWNGYYSTQLPEVAFVTGSAFVEEYFGCAIADEKTTAAEKRFGDARVWEVTAAEAWVCSFAGVA
jgi:hypothetical protein